ncbi:MAG: tRNA (adenosine(37)-N6)-threonylcarbamoyltransferase complex dimerization subunit type 1 TsaB [Alphaproteobacteria bacterium]|nr:tRNA (adenosine(37)-N6)-threonylcarbamoyltransferase complex dimerization subunit type 1 TsaB [Alphaproteobacteria bacterium]
MKVLGLDSTGGQCAVAVLDGERVAAAHAETMARGQAERLLPLIAETLTAAGIAPAALELIAATTGPGSFTGIRVGLATARGLALATGRQAVGVRAFDAYAAAVPPAARRGRALVVAVESKRDEFYLQAFAPGGSALGPAAQVLPRDVDAWLPSGPLLLAGDAAARLRRQIPARDATIAPGTAAVDAVHVAQLGRALLASGAGEPPRPFYLRAPDTTVPRRAAAP